MSASSTPIPGQTSITAEQVSAAVMAAASGLVQAGAFEGKLQIPPQLAIATAAEVFQRAYSREALRQVMATVAKRAGVPDAYETIINPPVQHDDEQV